MSTKFVLGNLVRLKTRQLCQMIGTPFSWDSWDSRLFKRFLSAVDELFFREENFKSYNHRELGGANRPYYQAYADASGTGLAAHIVIHGPDIVAYKNFSREEAGLSSTWRELFGRYFTLLAFKDSLIGKSVQWHIDNLAGSWILSPVSTNRTFRN